jgi:hypothetical protein
MNIEKMDVTELQRVIHSPDISMTVRNATAKRFKVLRREAGRSVRRKLEKHFGHPTPHE